ncbi:cAMP-dependent protein kinase catalytic subunit PRKX-like [Physella acuta]|uniref:cAMP-dependent protein kinase catalytic subunit PRKX-like n=1 Tax=Physella acuta TaxID=109671 RepID=UPI0027DE4ACF|nr:cAMP-dependent protein kinase catalytic subunit PRKX-like [Physella acuta]
MASAKVSRSRLRSSGKKDPPPAPAIITRRENTPVSSSPEPEPSSESDSNENGSSISVTTTISISNYNDTESSENELNRKMSESKRKGNIVYRIEDLDIMKTIGTGTFGRVVLTRHKESREYCALKVMAITQVIKLKQEQHIKSEKAILSSVSHPFIVNLLWHHKDETFLYMLMEYVPGGELFSYLRSMGKFSISSSNFYASEIVVALDYLHSNSIVYRDLKPENLLLDRDGHLKITDFGFAKIVEDRTWTLCGTPEYLAPEIILSKGHNKAVDWWSLGILIFEMLVGYPPFYADNPFHIYEKIVAGKVEWPKNIDLVAKDLIKKLLNPDRTRRLGNMRNGADDIKKHKWFKGQNWEAVYAKKLKPPIIPELSHDGDTTNFETYEECDWRKAAPAPESEAKLFQDF